MLIILQNLHLFFFYNLGNNSTQNCVKINPNFNLINSLLNPCNYSYFSIRFHKITFLKSLIIVIVPFY